MKIFFVTKRNKKGQTMLALQALPEAFKEKIFNKSLKMHVQRHYLSNVFPTFLHNYDLEDAVGS